MIIDCHRLPFSCFAKIWFSYNCPGRINRPNCPKNFSNDYMEVEWISSIASLSQIAQTNK